MVRVEPLLLLPPPPPQPATTPTRRNREQADIGIITPARRSRMRMIETVSMMLAVSPGAMTTIVAIPEVRKQMNGLGDPKAIVFILVPALVMMSTVVVFLLLACCDISGASKPV
jgi:hypothetical protein